MMKKIYTFPMVLTTHKILFFFLIITFVLVPVKKVLSNNEDKKQTFKTVIIKQGDTLAAICRSHYGKYSLSLLKLLLENNPAIHNSNHIIVGNMLRVPIMPRKILPEKILLGGDIKKKSYKTVIIKQGDTLAGICRQHYGEYTEQLLQSILKINPTIHNPDHINTGYSLYLPSFSLTKPEVTAKPDTVHPLPVPDPEPPLPGPEPPAPIDFSYYPPPMPGYLSNLTWISDNEAIIQGQIDNNATARFFVHVPGDLEYEQLDLRIESDNTFRVTAVIGRQGRDYNKEFILKLALIDADGTRIGEIRRSIVREQHDVNDEILLTQKNNSTIYKPHPVGWKGLKAWIGIQKIPAMQADNNDFQIPRGLIVPNYRYLAYNPDEKYLSWYGRITLYGSSCLSKALLLNGDIKTAEALLRVWVAQINKTGKIPRSANTIGDNYISPDVRTGDTSHFLGALALAKAITKSNEWDIPINKIINEYIQPLIDPETGLVQGGYNGKNSNGYTKPNGYSKVPWFSSEHNFDLFQALILLTRIDEINPEIREKYKNIANTIGNGIDNYLWDQNEGTFNRGWRKDTGHDRARALDCSSWGALYLIKQAKLFKEQGETSISQQYFAKAKRCLDYTEQHFKTKWNYETPNGNTGSIEGYRPYDGEIDDILWEKGTLKGEIINWNSLNNMVWSEGTLGVAKAWEEYEKFAKQSETNFYSNQKLSHKIYKQMEKLQSLSDQGGVLYSTVQIHGHFTMGEELASLSWLGYLTISHNKSISEYDDLIEWVAW